MKMVVCSVYDIKADEFAAPFCVRTKGEAIRMFHDVVNKESDENLWYKHPEDFVLYCLGAFLTDTGQYELLDSEEKLIAGNECRLVGSQPTLKAVQ